jgi:hypothetical protein
LITLLELRLQPGSTMDAPRPGPLSSSHSFSRRFRYRVQSMDKLGHEQNDPQQIEKEQLAFPANLRVA